MFYEKLYLNTARNITTYKTSGPSLGTIVDMYIIYE